MNKTVGADAQALVVSNLEPMSIVAGALARLGVEHVFVEELQRYNCNTDGVEFPLSRRSNRSE